ncbi:MAG: S-layer family protein, partial [Coleofasciculaceae cyanobacterium]
GGNISNIDGLIRAQGEANLFLINPQGIIFGPNAQLNLGGSFIASTANSIKFADGTQFDTNPTASALLTMNVPIGLQLGPNPGNIVNQSRAINGNGQIVGLQVMPGRTIGLVGGDINLEGGNLRAPQGRIELGSVADNSFVTLTPIDNGFALEYEGIDNFQDIRLSQEAVVDASGAGGGNIQLQGRQISVIGGSQVLTITQGNQAGGSLKVNASEFVNVSGASADGQVTSRLQTDTIAQGAGGDIFIETKQLLVNEGALVSASTFGAGEGGNLTILASELVEVSGTGIDNLRNTVFLPVLSGELRLSNLESGLLVVTEGAGMGGNLTIETSSLLVGDGALVSTTTGGAGTGGNILVRNAQSVEIAASSFTTGAIQGTTGHSGNLTINTQHLTLRDGGLVQTFTFGAGDGGKMLVNASESVELLSTPAGAVFPTGLFANSIFGTGEGGNIEVNTGRMTIRDGAQVGNQTGAFVGTGLIPFGGPGGDIVLNVTDSIEMAGISPDGRFSSGPGTSSFSGSPAGNVTVFSSNMTISGGAGISTTTFSAGMGGNLTVNVSDTLEIVGRGIVTISGMPIDTPSSLVSSSGRADFPNLQATGAAGELVINAGKVILREGAEIAVNSLGSGDAGRLGVTANSILLEDSSTITAETDSGEGGNIELETQDLRLRRGSNISTNAGNTDGGNISIDTGTLVALENSDITANAQQGRGGRVTISAQGIFGTEFREKLTPESDITATSELGLEFDGIVDINVERINPSQGLESLPENLLDPTQLIALSCAADAGNYFAVTGRGGLPQDPTNILRGGRIWRDLRLTRAGGIGGDGETGRWGDGEVGEVTTNYSQPTQIIEAQGWVINSEGKVELVADSTGGKPSLSGNRNSGCHL